MSITVIGSTFVDIKGYPENDFKLRGRNSGSVKYVYGGVGRNIAMNLCKLQHDVNFITVLDNTPISNSINTELVDAGVNRRFSGVDDNGLGKWLAVFDESGDVIASVSSRPNLHNIIYILDGYHDQIFKNSSGVIIEIDMDSEIIDRVIKYAELYHVPIYAVVSVMDEALKNIEYFNHTACFVCNLQEACQLFDIDINTPIEVIESFINCHIHTPRISFRSLVVTLGDLGCLYFDTILGLHGWVGVDPVEDIVDTTGAGDAFFSGLVNKLVDGDHIVDACTYGNKIAGHVLKTTQNTL